MAKIVELKTKQRPRSDEFSVKKTDPGMRIFEVQPQEREVHLMFTFLVEETVSLGSFVNLVLHVNWTTLH